LRIRVASWLLCLVSSFAAQAEGLDAARLGVLYNLDDPASREIALFYAAQRAIPPGNVIGLHLPNRAVISPAELEPLRATVLDRLPVAVQSLALVWSRPYAVGCMSVTTAMAAGYRAGFCEPGCARTLPNPLYDEVGWLPADTVGWWPAMMLPTDDRALARSLIQRGLAAERQSGTGVAYLVRTQDLSRNVRAATYRDVEVMLGKRLPIRELVTPVEREVPDAVAYFTGAAQVRELPLIRFRPGAAADHLTSTGGVLSGGHQMSALGWLRQGATASYGSVTEPCNHLGKFPSPNIFLRHYVEGETVLEAYWKSVAMPGQGLFIGEPLARPFGPRFSSTRRQP
jgi:uncharacterized protein (TIGR03790 family)